MQLVFGLFLFASESLQFSVSVRKATSRIPFNCSRFGTRGKYCHQCECGTKRIPRWGSLTSLWVDCLLIQGKSVCSQTGRRENVHANEKSAWSYPNQSDSMVRLLVDDPKVFWRRAICWMPSRCVSFSLCVTIISIRECSLGCYRQTQSRDRHSRSSGHAQAGGNIPKHRGGLSLWTRFTAATGALQSRRLHLPKGWGGQGNVHSEPGKVRPVSTLARVFFHLALSTGCKWSMTTEKPSWLLSELGATLAKLAFSTWALLATEEQPRSVLLDTLIYSAWTSKTCGTFSRITQLLELG